MKVNICISGRLHGMRDWDAVPRIGEDVFVHNIDNVKRPGPFRDGYLKVCAVLWEEEGATVNLTKDDQP